MSHDYLLLAGSYETRSGQTKRGICSTNHTCEVRVCLVECKVVSGSGNELGSGSKHKNINTA